MPPSIDMNVSSTNTIKSFVEDNEKVVINASIIGGAMLLHFAIYVLMKKVASRTEWIFDDELVKRSKWPTFALFPTVSVKIAWRTTTFIEDDNTNHLVIQILNIFAIIELAWLIVNVLRVGFSSLVRQNKWANSADNWKQRKAVTQIAVLKRLSYVIVFFGMISGIVFTFPSAWEIGMSLMASAGAAGLILGLAAKPGLENIIASLTIAFSQPITLEDEVVVEGEYGRVEEIRSQYVVVRTWDNRRLILPLSYFTSQSFQNWSKTSTWKIGVSLFYFDPLILAHLSEIRERLTHILTTTEPARKLWDGQVVNCAVTDIRPDGMVEVRVLASARTSPDTFDLRCTVRELLMAYVVQKWPGTLVRSRGEVRMFNDESDQWNRGDKARKTVDTLASSIIESTAAVH